MHVALHPYVVLIAHLSVVYMLAHELAPGRFRPTITHSFIKLLADKGLLSVCFTQNIDTLERRAGVPANRIIEAHGSFASSRCVDCKHPFPEAAMARAIAERTIPRCARPQVCTGLVKPDIVFFGESLPVAFTNGMRHTRDADLLLIMGTSLTVHPFASLAEMVDCPRVLLNLDPAGDIGSDPDDVLVLAKCDDAVRRIAAGMGWLDELEAEWAKTELKKPQEAAAPKSEETLAEKITKDVDTVLSKEEAPKQEDDVDKIAADLEKLGVDEREDVLKIPPPKSTPSLPAGEPDAPAPAPATDGKL